ncbi:hypothetical protein [Piscinibacter koreensis]|uniref:hypothetical protein n=1 Tax=Piscinibacter koreensis TaxID=2742824 RepID=UPI003158B841
MIGFIAPLAAFGAAVFDATGALAFLAVARGPAAFVATLVAVACLRDAVLLAVLMGAFFAVAMVCRESVGIVEGSRF